MQVSELVLYDRSFRLALGVLVIQQVGVNTALVGIKVDQIARMLLAGVAVSAANICNHPGRIEFPEAGLVTAV